MTREELFAVAKMATNRMPHDDYEEQKRLMEAFCMGYHFARDIPFTTNVKELIEIILRYSHPDYFQDVTISNLQLKIDGVYKDIKECVEQLQGTASEV